MRISEIKKMSDKDLMLNFTNEYAYFIVNYNTNRAIKSHCMHLDLLSAELIKRGIFEDEDFKRFNIVW